MKISMKLVYQDMGIVFIFPPTPSHLRSLPVENCGSNSRLVVDDDDNGKFRLERVKEDIMTFFKLNDPLISIVFINLFIAKHDYSRFKLLFLADQITVILNEISV